MPNDARNKLRSMGGIMASSPELMQAAVQGYQPGGMVVPTVPQMIAPSAPRSSGYAPGLLPTGTVDPRLSYSARNAPLSPADARRNEALEMGLERLRQDGPLTFGGGAQYRLSAPDMPFEPRVPMGPEAGQPERMDARVLRSVLAGEGSMGDEAGYTVDDLLEGSGAETFTVPETVPSAQRGPQDIMLLPEVIVGSVPYRVDVETGGVFRNDGTPVRGAEAEAALKQVPEVLYAAERASSSAAERRARKKLEANQERLKELDEEKIGGVAPNSEAAEEEAALKEETRALSDELGSFASAEDTVMSMPLTPTKLTQEQIDKANELAQKDPNISPAPASDAPSPDEGAGGGTGGGDETDTGDGTGG